MLEVVRTAASTHGLNIKQEVWVPGAVEKPLAAKMLCMQDDIDGIVVLGIIERGSTKHGLVLGHVMVDKLADVSLEFMKPICLGVIGPEVLPDQIERRIDLYAQKAVDAVATMLA